MVAVAVLTATTPAFAQRNATSPDKIHLPDGFKIELLYTVPRDEQGSWVAMCRDDKNRFIVSDQYGGLYRFPVPGPGEPLNPATIEPITYAADAPATKRGKKTAGRYSQEDETHKQHTSPARTCPGTMLRFR